MVDPTRSPTGRTCGVAGCVRPIPAGAQSTACPSCWARCTQALAEMPTLIDELDITITRQNVSASPVGGRSAETPVPFNVSASGARADIVRVLCEVAVDTDLPADPARPWLAVLAAERYLRRHPGAAVIVEDVTRVAAKGWRVVDRPADMVPLGKCWADVLGSGALCVADLYAPRGAVEVRCRTCGETHEVAGRHAFLSDLLADRLVTRREAVTMLRLVGIKPATQQGFSFWTKSGRLAVRGRIGRAEQYRWADVLNLHGGLDGNSPDNLAGFAPGTPAAQGD